MTNRHRMKTLNLVISFDYSWFLAKNLSSFVPLPWKLHNRYCHNLEQYNYMINHEYYTLASLENTKVYQQHLGMCGILCAFYLWLQKSQKKEWRIMVKLELWVDTLQCVRLVWWLFKLFQYKKMICMDESLSKCLLKHFFTVSWGDKIS